MRKLLERLGNEVNGVVTGWDRLALRATIRWLASAQGLATYLSTHNVLFKDFSSWAQQLTKKIRQACSDKAEQLAIRCEYLQSSGIDKEARARQVAQDDHVVSGPICMFSVVEPAWSPTVVGSKATGHLEIQVRPRRCVWIYVYFDDPEIGFGHLRLQSWLPFTIKGCINGRHWLEKSLKREGIGYIMSDNCFRWIADPLRAQQLLDEQLKVDWAKLFNRLVDEYFPVMRELFGNEPLNYYWSIDESEVATDIMLRNSATLDRLFPMLARYALVISDSASVMRYLGRIDADAALPKRVSADIRGDRRRRAEGICVKHRDGANSVKMYNKAGNVLRVETTINDPRAFKVFRQADDDPNREPGWLQMRKGVADLERRSQISRASNERYCDALAACPTDSTLLESIEVVCRPVVKSGRRVRALNPCSAPDFKLLKFLAQGEWSIKGLRNKDLAQWLEAEAEKLDKTQRKKLSGRVSRLLSILRGHGLIRKVSNTHRYMVTEKGKRIASVMTCTSAVQATDVMELAA